MVGIIYADPDKAIKAAFQYINEVQEDVFVHELSYGQNNKKHLGNEK